MRRIDPILQEFEAECGITRRVLERVPDGRLDWKPHARSMSLGGLAMHLATIPGGIAKIALEGGFDLAGARPPVVPGSKAEILAVFEEGIRTARQCLDRMDDRTAMETFRLTKGGKEVLSVPRIGVVRTILLNHSCHHRGQLSVYLRLLDVPVPSIYGPSADEDPFA